MINPVASLINLFIGRKIGVQPSSQPIVGDSNPGVNNRQRGASLALPPHLKPPNQ